MPEAKATQSAFISKKRESTGSNIHHWVIILLIFIVGLGGLFLYYQSQKHIQYNVEKWQAVFLDNGQVYFGHVTGVNKNEVTIENIYYLQVVARPLQRSFSGDVAGQQEQQLTLIKLGNEIHGPVDAMNINRIHVLLIEDLKPDSRVVGAITNYESGQQ